MTNIFKTVDPSSGKVVAEFSSASNRQNVEAIDAAYRAYRDWQEESLGYRADLLHGVAEIYRERSQHLAELIALEMGKPVKQAAGEIAVSSEIFDYYAMHAQDFLKPQLLKVASGSAEVRTQATGVLLGIMPWNYPHYQVARFAAPNLVLGNTILLKHATNCPQSALAIQEVLEDAGIPQGVYTNIFATHTQVSDIIADPRIQGISFTGSERAGAIVAEQAGRNLKKVVLELGGSDPFIVLDSVKLKETAEAAVFGRLSNAGQACTSPKRLIVVEEVYDSFLAEVKRLVENAVVGSPFDGATDVGPISSDSARAALTSQLQDASDHGATVHIGGQAAGQGFYFSPALVTGITPACRLWHEEAFGPIVMIYKVKDEDEAIKLANDSPYGLGAAVYGADTQQTDRVADRLESGMVFVNSNTDSQAELPFGGVKRSGFGRELGPLGIQEFANRKMVKKISAS
ncbi:NAD-dependent succinate-semialdehyde dehydrogenase [Yaniella flava]|uniref:NAD-dependent succinate-semialdehyde dehydrogenase n=1 Tax=Yaniella flava TaxID=287930 RepID=A0ABN2U5S0_9MICC